MRTTASGKGQIVVPAEIRVQTDVKPSQEREVRRIELGEYRLKRTARGRNEGLVELLLACPVKGWFQPLDRTEQSPDTGSAQPPSFRRRLAE